MGFAEALVADGKLSGRGTRLMRGLVCGLMTVAGGIWIQRRYMDTPPVSAAAKVMLGGGLVLSAGVPIGQAR